jgi:hypothetical protein
MPETIFDFRDTNVIWIAKVIQDPSLLPPKQNVRLQFLGNQRIIDIGGGWRA